MDATIVILLLILFGAASVIYGIYGIRINEIKGVIGERTVSRILHKLDTSAYQVLDNVVLHSGERITQIDHIVVAEAGVFVIETKNYKGWILGVETSEYWTQVLFQHKEKLYNPIRQNNSHIAALKNLLHEFKHIRYISLIVFSTRAELKVQTQTPVIYTHNLLDTIDNYSNTNLTIADQQAIVAKICTANMSADYNKEDHITSIQQSIQRRERLVQANVCPQCGGNLIERKGHYGRFMGCGNYPRCRFTRSL